MNNDILVPNPLDTDSQYVRFHHLDVSALDDIQIVDEINCLRVHLWRLPLDHWLRERVEVLKGELTKRKWNARSKPKIAMGMS